MKKLAILLLLATAFVLHGCGDKIEQTTEDKGPNSASAKAAREAGKAGPAGAGSDTKNMAPLVN